jgi:hypothetical protein
MPIIEGDAGAAQYIHGHITFNNLAGITPPDPRLTFAAPDRYYGAKCEQLQLKIRHELKDVIIPSTTEHLPMAPNLFVEIKSLKGTLEVALRQTCYYGAIGARGLHRLQSHGTESPSYDNRACTL